MSPEPRDADGHPGRDPGELDPPAAASGGREAGNQGPPGPESLSGSAVARAALAAAREGARARRLERERQSAAGRRSAARRGADTRGGRPSADPVSFGAALSQVSDQQGWTVDLATARVLGDWPAVVGPEVAAHTRPERLRDGELLLVADSTAWATQLRLLTPTVMRRLREALGAGVVTSLKVRGPTGPRRSAGPLRVRGGRGPRDTYG